MLASPGLHLCLLLAFAAPARGAGGKAPRPAEDVKYVLQEDLGEKGFWTPALPTYFSEPSVSDEQRRALAREYPGPWNVSQILEFDGDGKAVALLARGFMAEPREAEEGDYFATELILAKWDGKSWRRLVRLDPRSGIQATRPGARLRVGRKTKAFQVTFDVVRRFAADGGEIDHAARLWLQASSRDSAGDPSGTSALLYYAPETDEYGLVPGDGD